MLLEQVSYLLLQIGLVTTENRMNSIVKQCADWASLKMTGNGAMVMIICHKKHGL